MGLIASSLGLIEEADVARTIVPQPDGTDCWVYAHEGRYIGTNPEFSQHVGTIVRRDVWVVVKRGQVAQAASEIIGVSNG